MWMENEDGGVTTMANNTTNIEALANGEKWAGVLLFDPLQKGERQEVEILLLKDTGDGLPLNLWVDVT